MRIILASQSLQRIQFMRWLNIPFQSVNSDINEMKLSENNPEKLTRRLSEAKAQAVAKNFKNAIVIGSDAVVSFDNKILKKPRNKSDQRKMLCLQRGKPATVVTSVCIINTKTGRKLVRTKKTRYIMAHVSRKKIEAYIKKGVGLYRAGGYGQQDEKGLFIGSKFDCYPNSIGFPICLVAKMIKGMGVKITVNIKSIIKEKTGHSC